jgi:hypothetical protein
MAFTIILLSVSLCCSFFYIFTLLHKFKKFSDLIPISEQKIILEKEIEGIKSQIENFEKLMSVKQSELKESEAKIESNIKNRTALIKNLESKIEELKKLESEQIGNLDLVDVSFYSPRYNFLKSEEYKVKLDQVKADQKSYISEKRAIRCDVKWEVGGSTKEGEKMTNQNIKLGLSSYNGQVDNIILTATYKNISKCEEKINKVRDTLNRMMESNKCYVTNEYHATKIKELYLAYEYENKLNEEKEEQKIIRLRMQEEEREARAIEKVKDEAEKEEKEFLKELAKAKKEFEKSHDAERTQLEMKILELEEKLKTASEKKERALSMAMQTKRGHVYIISNLGSFGENVFKIGLTRRLDPQERIDELGDASVPFEFDVHGLIFSEDAPALESKLHDHFYKKTVNKMNPRKEFFEVTIHEIDEVCKKMGLKVELTKLAEAKEYRQSLEIKKQGNKVAA